MKIVHITQAEFNKIEGVRRVIVHDYPHQFAIIDLGEKLGHYGLSWRSSPIIQPIVTISNDKKVLWLGVDQRLVVIDVQDGHICLSMPLDTYLFQIQSLDDITIVLTELEVLIFNNYDFSIRCTEDLPEVAADITVNGSDLVIRLMEEKCLILNLNTLQLKEPINIH
ncbi:MAG TPA: hypothetical protein VK211_03980 [Kamptonema sp.]|nr:hypothetical protein [Kamptonema sp.]